MDLGLSRKIALITGGSKGIGLACAELLAREGCRVAITSRNKANLDAAAKRIKGCFAQAADLTSPTQAAHMIDAVEGEIGPIDILVNSAGAAQRTPPDDLEPAGWRAAMDAKFFTYIHVIDPLIKRMAARRNGIIVNVIGNGGKVASPTHIAGGAANAALMLATAGLASAYASRGIRVVGINPGLTNTDRVAEGLRADARLSGTSPEESLKRALARIPLGRMAEPQEIARVVCFLASSQASYVSGVTITMDGVSTPLVV
ncbi:MAG: SDR family oxidoreductase [Methylobacteriaceae bacterium]|nr:SDR family oxidoreductase [Methylobacteriaceae bacterium]